MVSLGTGATILSLEVCSLGPRLSSSFSSLAVRKSDEKLDESPGPRLGSLFCNSYGSHTVNGSRYL